jgi:hypothetical protein
MLQRVVEGLFFCVSLRNIAESEIQTLLLLISVYIQHHCCFTAVDDFISVSLRLPPEPSGAVTRRTRCVLLAILSLRKSA